MDRGDDEVVGLGNVLSRRRLISNCRRGRDERLCNYSAAVVLDPYRVLLLVYTERSSKGGINR